MPFVSLRHAGAGATSPLVIRPKTGRRPHPVASKPGDVKRSTGGVEKNGTMHHASNIWSLLMVIYDPLMKKVIEIIHTHFVNFDHFHMLASHKRKMTNNPRKGPGFFHLLRLIAFSYYFKYFHAFFKISPNHHTFPRPSRCFFGFFPGAFKKLGPPWRSLGFASETEQGRDVEDGCTMVALPQATADRLVWAALHLLLPVSAYEVLALGNFFGLVGGGR